MRSKLKNDGSNNIDPRGLQKKIKNLFYFLLFWNYSKNQNHYFEDGLKTRPAILMPMCSISSEFVLLSSDLFSEY